MSDENKDTAPYGDNAPFIKVKVLAASVYLDQEVAVFEGDDEDTLRRRVIENFFDEGMDTPYSGWVTDVIIPAGAIAYGLTAYDEVQS